MNNKTLFFLAAIGLASVESHPRVGHVSRQIARALNFLTERERIVQLRVRETLEFQKTAVAFMKTEEFKKILGTLTKEAKKEIKEQGKCLQDHAQDPFTRKMMVEFILAQTVKSLDQTLQLKSYITSTDVIIAVVQSAHQYSQENSK